MTPYEFSASESAVFKTLATRLSHIGLLTIAAALVRIVYALSLWSSQGFGGRVGYWLVGSTLTVVLGVFLWRPAANFRRIADTTGQDIAEFMGGVKELNAGFTLVQVLMAVIAVLSIVDLVRMLLLR